MRRVVVTGIGVVSPVGTGRERFWSSLTAGRSGIGVVDLFDTSAMPVRIGGQVAALAEAEAAAGLLAAAGERDRKVRFGMLAAAEAIEDAGLAGGELAGAVFYAGVGLETFCLEDITPFAGEASMGAALARAVLADGNGAAGVQTPLDRLGRLACGRWGIGGGCWTNGSACAAGAQAVGEAMRLIRDGECTTAVAGATDSMLNPLGLGGFTLLRVLSSGNGDPAGACRPFDAGREGTVLGEGAALLVLEEAESAEARGGRAYAEVLGYGSSMDAFAVSDPDPTGEGARLAMRAALADAGIEAGDVDCVSAHGTGTVKNDVVETAAIKAVLGERTRQVPVHAVKSMTGHMIAASGAVEAAAAALTVARRTVPPTINLTRPDPLCDLDYTAGASRPFDGDVVLSNSFGFGGQNATLLFGRYEP